MFLLLKINERKKFIKLSNNLLNAIWIYVNMVLLKEVCVTNVIKKPKMFAPLKKYSLRIDKKIMLTVPKFFKSSSSITNVLTN